MIGTSLIHYRLTAKLGAGGMGEVYRATDTKLGREVAIKVLPEQFSESRESVARFEREAKVLASLDHPNIAAIYGFEQARGTRFLVLQLVEGETLAERLQRGALPLRTTLEVCRQISEALEAAHEKGLIHRDLKPANVKIAPDGKVKVLDFGIAKGLSDEPSAQKNVAQEDTPTVLTASTRTGAILGTPAYMSPEQARGEPVDKRSDIWSFGCLLYECLSGTKLFAAETPIDSLHAVLHKEPDWSALPIETPARIQHLVQRCLARDLKKRLRDIRDASVEIEAAISEPASLSSPIGRAVAGLTSEPKSKSVVHSKKRFFPRTLTVVGVLVIAAVSWWAYHRFGPSQKSNPPSPTKSPGQIARAVNEKSVAVLPFVNLSEDKNDEYLSDGFSEEIITALSKIKGLKVPARTSCFAFKGKNEDIQKIGQQLRVSTVLEGSISKAGNKLRVTAQLINIADGFHLWSDTYDRALDDLLAIRTEVAARVAEALKGQLLGEEKQQLAKRGTESAEANRLYLQGRYLWNRRTVENLKKAIQFFNDAISNDSSYALAYAGLADCYHLLPYYANLPDGDILPKARAAALKALELDNSLVEPHATLAGIKADLDWDWAGAEAEFRRAIELNPNYATTHHWFSDLLSTQGRLDEALMEIKRALDLDPLSPIINAVVGEKLYEAGKDDLAVELLQKQIALDPSFVAAHNKLGFVYIKKGKLSEAIAELETARRLNGSGTYALDRFGLAYARAGRTNDAQKILGQMRELLSQGIDNRVAIALVEHALGDDEGALDSMEKAVAEHAHGIASDLNANPFWKDLRPHPRVQAILKKMNLVK